MHLDPPGREADRVQQELQIPVRSRSRTPIAEDEEGRRPAAEQEAEAHRGAVHEEDKEVLLRLHNSGGRVHGGLHIPAEQVLRAHHRRQEHNPHVSIIKCELEGERRRNQAGLSQASFEAAPRQESRMLGL